MTVREKSGNVSGSACLRRASSAASAVESAAAGSDIARLRGQRANPIPALGRLHDAPKRRKAAPVEETRGDAVGRDHQVLDQRLGAVSGLRLQVAQRVPLEHVLHFDRLEVERADSMPGDAERLRDPVLHPQLLVHAGHGRRGRRQRSVARQPGADGVVGELRVIPRQRAVDIRCRDVAGWRQRRTR